MKKLALPLLVLTFAASAFAGDQDNQAANRVKAASVVLEEIQTAPDTGIPDEVMGSAECVAVVPSMLKAGFVFGAQYGRGVASCRTAKGWSDPAFFAVQGGSFGLQIGGQAVDLVMLIMNHKGMENLLNSKFKLGADATVAAGPVGRHAAADTDWKMRAQVHSGFGFGIWASGSGFGLQASRYRQETPTAENAEYAEIFRSSSRTLRSLRLNSFGLTVSPNHFRGEQPAFRLHQIRKRLERPKPDA